MTTADNKLPKEERLHSKNIIDKLFSQSSSFVVYPLRVVYKTLSSTEQEASAAMFVSVPKKKFKRAVKRNLIRRRIKEAYRLNKAIHIPVLKEKDLHLAIAFLYLDKEIRDYGNIEKKMKEALEMLICKISPDTDKTETTES